jgi:membrane-bound lytic murein transglycosylase MltF
MAGRASSELKFGIALLLLLAWVSACDAGPHSQPAPDVAETAVVDAQPDVDDEAVAEPQPDDTESVSTGELLPMPMRVIWEPWTGDFEAMVERRLIRVVVPYGGYQFYYQDGVPRGATYDLLRRYETHLNEQLGRGHVKVYVVAIPVGRDELIPSLLNGNADLVAADLTITDERSAQVDFARPMLSGINEVVVTGPDVEAIGSIDDLAGREIVVRESSSYYEHLQALVAQMERDGLEAPVIVAADEILEAEDLLEMIDGGIIDITVLDDYKAEFWAGVFPDIVVREDLVVNRGGAIAWAMRKDSPQLAASVEGFLRKYGKGTLVGNDTYNRYLSDAARVRCSFARRPQGELKMLVETFRKYGEEFDFDWMMLAAQAYQESGFRQNRKSPAGAIGIMQIKPSTAADKNVGIDDISTVDGNVHAGAKYLRFLADRYFSDEPFDDLSQWLFSLAAYNAGPAKVARLRREAAEQGYDPNRWFDNVEIIAARRIGRETVTYVSNVFKYYVGYQLTSQRRMLRADRHGEVLDACSLIQGQ